jgi:CBS domain-containing protein
MKKRTPISQIMSKDVITVNKTQTIKEVSDLINNRSIHHIPVVSGKEIIGMLSSTDLQKISFINTVEGGGITTAMWDVVSIEQVMSKNVTTAQKEDTIHDVAQVLATSNFHALPVMDNEEVVGIVTSTDLLKYLVDQY